MAQGDAPVAPCAVHRPAEVNELTDRIAKGLITLKEVLDRGYGSLHTVATPTLGSAASA